VWHWDGPSCWIDDGTLVVWGYGRDARDLLDAAIVIDVERGETIRWFAGPPRGRFAFDGHLVVVAESGTTVWDVRTGERLHEAPAFRPVAFHPVTREHVSLDADRRVVRSRLVSG
jgi:hypothetical protein